MNPYMKAMAGLLAGGAMMYPEDADAATPKSVALGQNILDIIEPFLKNQGLNVKTRLLELPKDVVAQVDARKGARDVQNIYYHITDPVKGGQGTVYHELMENPTFWDALMHKDPSLYIRTGMTRGDVYPRIADAVREAQYTYRVNDASPYSPKGRNYIEGKNTTDLSKNMWEGKADLDYDGLSMVFTPKKMGGMVPMDQLTDTIGGYLLGQPLGMGGIFGAMALPLMAKQFSERGDYPQWY